MEVATNSFDPFKEVWDQFIALECFSSFPVTFLLPALLSVTGFLLKACGGKRDRTMWTSRGM